MERRWQKNKLDCKYILYTQNQFSVCQKNVYKNCYYKKISLWEIEIALSKSDTVIDSNSGTKLDKRNHLDLPFSYDLFS